MNLGKVVMGCGLLVLAAMSQAQVWQTEYDRALKAASQGQWAEARDAFLAAVADRGEDSNQSTRLPGPITEPRVWRSGALYSPNFGAAYSAYRLGVMMEDKDEKNRLFGTAAGEMEALITKGQRSAEAFKILTNIYSALGTQSRMADFEPGKGMDWKVDTSFLQANEVVNATAPGQASNTGTGASVTGSPNGAGSLIKVKAGNEEAYRDVILSTPVPVLNTKFALLIGNSESKIEDLKVETSATDVDLLKAALMQHAGYAEENIVVLKNATSAQMRDAARAMAEKVGGNSTVFVFFSGAATNVDGVDFYAGVNTEFAKDTSTMLRKRDLQQVFVDKGAKLFVFNQTHRTVVSGSVFGSERSVVGSVAESHATIAGANVYATSRDGQKVGLYVAAMTQSLEMFHLNEIPVTEFAWQVFNAIRRGGDTVAGGGGSIQTPTLPVVTNMSNNAPF